MNLDDFVFWLIGVIGILILSVALPMFLIALTAAIALLWI